MKKNRAFLPVLISLLFVISITSQNAIGQTTWIVDDDGPADFSTIQAAINTANSGDTVFVRAGTYYEHITIGKSLILQGENRNTTIIDGTESGDAIYVTASYVTISGFKLRNGECGIRTPMHVPTLNHITMKDLIITSNGNVGEPNFRGGIIIKKSHSPGVDSYHIIEDCIISDNELGILLYRSPETIIRNCEFFGNGWTMNIRYTSNVLIADNELHHNLVGGMYLNGFTNSIIERNYIHSNMGTAMQFSRGANYNIVRYNIARNNSGAGINMKTTWQEKGNKIYNNDFIENTLQAFDGGKYPGLNIWDNGYPDGGNYWSDYTGVDGNNDGIGDTPYVFEGNQDNYPLMRPKNFALLATVDIDANTLNLKSKGKWITVYIELPEGYDVADIDVSSIFLNDSVPAEEKPNSIGDYDDDGIIDLMVKFNRDSVISLLEMGDEVEITISGELNDGRQFEGKNTIKVIKKGK